MPSPDTPSPRDAISSSLPEPMTDEHLQHIIDKEARTRGGFNLPPWPETVPQAQDMIRNWYGDADAIEMNALRLLRMIERQGLVALAKQNEKQLPPLVYHHPEDGLQELDSSLYKFVDVPKYLKMSTVPTTDNDTADCPFAEMTWSDIHNGLASNIVRDQTTSTITFAVDLLTYTHQDQAGILNQAGSSTGKSHVALAVTHGYFPPEDIIEQDYTSPTAFFHKNAIQCIRGMGDTFFPILSHGEYVTQQMKRWLEVNPSPKNIGDKTLYRDRLRDAQRAFRDEWEGLNIHFYQDFSRKILLFKDMPHDQVMQNLRSKIAKDAWFFFADITDRNSSGRHATKNVVLAGFPTYIFCSAKYSQDEQERTRFFLLSPELTDDKITESTKMALKRDGDRAAFQRELDEHTARQALRERVLAVRQARIDEIVVPPDLIEYVYTQVLDIHKSHAPRLMRDAPKLLQLIKSHALFNFANRHPSDAKIVAEQRDVNAGIELYKQIATANELGIPQQILDFYQKRLEPTVRAQTEEDRDNDHITREQFTKLWFDHFKEQIGHKRSVDIVRLMENAGLVREDINPGDRREKIIHVLQVTVHSAKERQESLSPSCRDRS